jgi:hypothetical protein
MNVRTLILVLPTALLALAGCAGSQASTREEAATTGTASRQQEVQAQADMCPMQVKGTQVEAINIENGVAMTFTTTGDVAELRRRVTALAEMHNAHHGGAGAAAGCACPHHEGQSQACKCPAHGAGSGQGGSGCADCPKHGEGQACACPKHGGDGKGMEKGMHMPASRATTEEVEGGMVLALTPVDAAQLDALRESVHHHAERMRAGQCPMMRSSQKHGG